MAEINPAEGYNGQSGAALEGMTLFDRAKIAISKEQ